ncbi:MAG TPA: hypothetical protein VFH95_10910 [Candidatus Kapabacteria bacterium]|nr:hypothetical protein [Candidatus Kapabacteria bacterium]
MKQSSAIKTSIRHRQKERTVSVLRFSEQEKNKIRRLAKLRGESASKSVMDLVEGALEKSKERKSLPIEQIMKLPAAERHKLLEEQAKDAAQYYKNDPDLIFNANDDIIEY